MKTNKERILGKNYKRNVKKKRRRRKSKKRKYQIKELFSLYRSRKKAICLQWRKLKMKTKNRNRQIQRMKENKKKMKKIKMNLVLSNRLSKASDPKLNSVFRFN